MSIPDDRYVTEIAEQFQEAHEEINDLYRQNKIMRAAIKEAMELLSPLHRPWNILREALDEVKNES